MNRFRKVSLAAVTVGLFAAGSANAVTVKNESFESGSAAVYYGAGSAQDCTTAADGACSAVIDPACCSLGAGVEVPVNLPMLGTTSVEFKFRADSLYGDVDSTAVVYFDNGHAALHVTDGVFPNNGVSLSTPGGSTGAFTSWPTAGTWHTFRITVDPNADTVTATLVGGGSATLPIGANAGNISHLDFGGIRWSSYGSAVRYDAVKVDTAPVCVIVCL